MIKKIIRLLKENELLVRILKVIIYNKFKGKLGILILLLVF